MPTFDQIKRAYKRGMHFGEGIADGPFCALRSPIGNNYARILDGCDSELEELCAFHEWACGLNRLADSRLVAEDQGLREAFASFVSLLWLDPRKL